MIIKPRLDYVVLKVEEKKDTTTKSGIVVVQKNSNDDRQQFGIVMAVGEGRILESGDLMPLGLSEGQKVMFNKYAGTEIKAGTKDDGLYILIHERDIIATIE